MTNNIIANKVVLYAPTISYLKYEMDNNLYMYITMVIMALHKTHLFHPGTELFSISLLFSAYKNDRNSDFVKSFKLSIISNSFSF